MSGVRGGVNRTPTLSVTTARGLEPFLAALTRPEAL